VVIIVLMKIDNLLQVKDMLYYKNVLVIISSINVLLNVLRTVFSAYFIFLLLIYYIIL
jgi:hypothetical protein